MVLNINFNSVAFVKLDNPIQSRWQADFLQVFPPNYDKLPCEHESDKDVFIKHYSDEPITFEEFKRKKYHEQSHK
jgi:hypothetical protein